MVFWNLGFLLLWSSSVIAQNQTVLFKLDQRTARTGETVCLNFTASQFKQLLSMQYTVKWDPKVLQFKEVKNFKLPFLGIDNFGRTRIPAGLLTVVWIDNDLRGITLPDNSLLYQICFTVKGKAGSRSSVSLVQAPTPFESVNKQEKLVRIVPTNGAVTVK